MGALVASNAFCIVLLSVILDYLILNGNKEKSISIKFSQYLNMDTYGKFKLHGVYTLVYLTTNVDMFYV